MHRFGLTLMERCYMSIRRNKGIHEFSEEPNEFYYFLCIIEKGLVVSSNFSDKSRTIMAFGCELTHSEIKE
ncbi:unnamed protein product [Blepharisma stoltei]|uniref:Uncharacterized protein n=1 Tax=Blepharisma stoltei TaxID=1481888 RepID=A0AAU9KB59_9CILI|nr:unnamed protein product [Blepharisma stoltei]